MSDGNWRSDLNELLGNLGDALDVPPSKYEDAKQRYDAVGTWLNEKDSPIGRFRPDVYPQGSFALGTVVRPLGEDDYDIDAVCLLHTPSTSIDQRTLKAVVGDRIKAHGTYAKMLQPEGKRCWTLKYADESRFHMDILPSVPDDYDWLVAAGVPREQAKHAICITDRELLAGAEWPRSNPAGYADWFKGQMRKVLEERRKIVAMEKRAEVQQVPDYEVHAPLQRAVQLLKRHRDLRYNGDDDKPISIIITTLAARAYQNEPFLLDALTNMIPRMRFLSQTQRDGVFWIPNPVNPRENFADRWVKAPRKAQLFFEWMASLEELHHHLLGSRDADAAGQLLEESYGEGETREAMVKYANARQIPKAVPAVLVEQKKEIAIGGTYDVPHRQRPQWPQTLKYRVAVSATASREGFRTTSFERKSPPLAKHMDLKFVATTNVPEPYDVYWQVVNTGPEAQTAGQLRGRIFPGDIVRKESTLYRGTHWVECFIVRNGTCVARSGEVVVNVN